MTAKNDTSEVSSRLYIKMTMPARRRFLSLGASISRLICASDSSPDIARIEWPKAIRIPKVPIVRAPGKCLSHPSESAVNFNSNGGRCAPRDVNRQPAPSDHDHGHHGRDLHDPHRLAAGLLDAENILAPEIDGDRDREKGGGEIRRQYNGRMRQLEQFVDQTDHVLSRRHAADRSGQDVVEHQGRHRDFRQRRAHRFFDDAIDAAAREHRARFHVHGAHRVREQHDGENEVRRGAAAGLLDDAADVVG